MSGNFQQYLFCILLLKLPSFFLWVILVLKYFLWYKCRLHETCTTAPGRRHLQLNFAAFSYTVLHPAADQTYLKAWVALKSNLTLRGSAKYVPSESWITVCRIQVFKNPSRELQNLAPKMFTIELISTLSYTQLEMELQTGWTKCSSDAFCLGILWLHLEPGWFSLKCNKQTPSKINDIPAGSM